MPSRLAKLAISSRSAPQGNEWELHAAPEDEHVILLWNSQVKVHPLPVVLFPGGHVAFVQRSPWRWGQRVAGRRAATVGLLSTTPSRALGGPTGWSGPARTHSLPEVAMLNHLTTIQIHPQPTLQAQAAAVCGARHLPALPYRLQLVRQAGAVQVCRFTGGWLVMQCTPC